MTSIVTSDALARVSTDHAATGLAAAWLLDRFAGFRTVTLYLPEVPAPELQSALSFREDARGANVWLVVPNDEGIFFSALRSAKGFAACIPSRHISICTRIQNALRKRLKN